MAISETTGLEAHGVNPRGSIFWNPSASMCYTHSLAREEARLAEGGPLVVDTGRHTGRSPKDRFVVREPGSDERIAWGSVNQPISEDDFDGLRDKVVAQLESGDAYVVDAFAGADPAHRLAVRVVTESPWHALFARTLFINPSERELADHRPDALVLHAPSVAANPDEDGTRSETFILLHPTRAEVVIGGTLYAGEIKKSIFALMNDRLPLEGVFPMHCSANVDDDGRVAVFFGLSGTGKTTLSADPERRLIGDDEHGWGEAGVFNFEGGCYAKVIRLSRKAEPEIYRTTRTFGTVLENVVIDERGVLDLDDDSKTENTRAAYKLEQIRNALPAKRAGHPSFVVFLTADAFGILPPIARLTRDQALYLLSLRLHRQARRHGDRGEGAAADLLGLLRRAVSPSAPAVYARCSARSSTPTTSTSGSSIPAGRVGRTARASACRSQRPAGSCGQRSRMISRTSSIASTQRSGSTFRFARTGSIRASSTRARLGATPRPTTPRRASWRRCSARISSVSTTLTKRCAWPAPVSDASPRAFPIASLAVEAKHDVLIVGAGCAGMRAAIEAFDAGADVAVISKIHPTRSHSGAAEGGINAALGNASEDDPEKHAFDTVKGSDYLGDQDAIEVLCQEAPADVYQLEHWGAVFSRTDDGRIAQRPSAPPASRGRRTRPTSPATCSSTSSTSR